MKPFRKKTTVWKLDGKKVPAGTPGASKEVIDSGKWYGTVAGRHVPLCTDYQAATRILKKRAADAELKRAGLTDPHAESKAESLARHFADFENHLAAKGNTPAHVAATMRRLRKAAEECDWTSLGALSVGKLETWLTGRRGTAGTKLPSAPAEYTPAEVSVVLGCSRENVGKLIRTNGLPAPSGAGKSRRIPRATVQSLLDLSARGTGPKTRNYYRKHFKHFGTWLVRDGRVAVNPFLHVELESTEADVRRHRRDASVEELVRLIQTTRQSPRAYRGLTGEDRAMLYVVGFATGFRASALASLTPEHFLLNASPPAVALAARNNKSRKAKTNPLTPDAAEALKGFLADKSSGMPVWPGTWPATAADMLRADLAAAGIEYVKVVAGERTFLDFHAVGRHSCLTHAARAGVPLSVVQKLAGHASPVTTARYVHTSDRDLEDAVGRLPGIAYPSGEAAPVCTQFARTPCKSGQSGSSSGNEGVEVVSLTVVENALNSPGFVADKQALSTQGGDGASGIRTRNQGIMSPLL
jgi:integrase/recombinase XerC